MMSLWNLRLYPTYPNVRLNHLSWFFTLVIFYTSWLCPIALCNATEDVECRLGQRLHQLASSDSPEPCVDIVAVHGLDGHWKRSWTAPNDVFWLRDLLPSEIPCGRIFSYSHDSRTRGSETPLDWDVSDHAKALLTSLSTERRLTQTERTPIIFIGHSLGGIILKAALVKAELARVGHLEHFKAIKLSTYGVMFLGTPHQGGEGIPLAEVLRRLSSIVSHTNKRILSKMERNSPWLQELQSDYNAISQDVETIFFYETLKLDVGPMSLLIVPKHSAVISGARNSEDVPLIADHASMVKFSTRTDDGFQKLVKRLRIFAKAAKPKIDENWKDWEWLNDPRSTQRQQSTAAQDDKEFLLGIVPNIVRNPYFTGRNEILNSLGQKLSSTRRTKKSNVVVLHGAGGMGKTQIAIEFMYRHEADYTSLFWIDGSRDYTAASDVLTSIKTIQRHYEVHGLRKKHWYGHIKETLANRLERARIQKHQIPTDNLSDADDQSLQEMFLAWLSSDGNCGWLMVIDNVDDLKRFDFRDWLAPTLCGSIIITSRLSDLARHWASIEVDGMTIEESIRLLNESSRAVPADESSQEWRSSLELIQDLGHLPLAISQAGNFIAMAKIGSPISNYLVQFRSHPKESFKSTGIHFPWESSKETVWTTWEISYEAVRESNPLAAQILLVCGFLSPGSISAPFFAGQSAKEFEIHQAFGILNSYSLLKQSFFWGDRIQIYSIHPLIHFWIRYKMDNESQKAMARRAAKLLRTYNRNVDKSGRVLSSSSHIKHLLSIYGDLYPCNTHPSEIICIAAPNREEIIRDVSQGYSLTSVAEGWVLRLRGWMDEFYVFLKAVYQSHEDYGHADYKLLYSVRESRCCGVSADTMDWILCQALKSHPPKHPRILEMIGNYAFSIHNDPEYPQHDEIALAWYWWLVSARTQVLGPFHPATAGAYVGIGMTLPYCEETVTVQLKACNIRVAALGYDDFLTRNALKHLAFTSETCQLFGVGEDKNVLSLVGGLIKARGVEMATEIFGVRFMLSYHMVSIAYQDVTSSKPSPTTGALPEPMPATALPKPTPATWALPELMPTTWVSYLTTVEVFFDLLENINEKSAKRLSRHLLKLLSGLKTPFSWSSEEYKAFISAQPYLLGLRAMVKTVYEVEEFIYYPPAELQINMSSYRKEHYWSTYGWTWRQLIPLACTVEGRKELFFDQSFLLRNDFKDDPLDQRWNFKWFDLLGPVLLEVKLSLVKGTTRLYQCVYLDRPDWLTPTNFY